jgi:hypothetical protein
MAHHHFTSNASPPQTIGGQMIKGIAVTYIHTPNKKMVT